MARFFSQSDIDKFKECFNYHCHRGYAASENELSVIMRSLGYSPTRDEVIKYFKKYGAVDLLFKEGGIQGQQVRYNEFVKNIMTPVPDY
ncbi:hypothetical protein KUTeg_010920 [Tegillarca granosa]|uniref:Uncharacterized protein n=1 Tax=Tegillarca granosa TaxID=220873 RepID=A0ABQ9F7L3_TEGGR|nr:hypothetical protein KUTeg_010920 [Tegillarca granosa]